MRRASKWKWREELTLEEAETVAKWDAAHDAYDAALKQVQALGAEYDAIHARAVQRAKLTLAKAAAAAPGCVDPLNARSKP